MACPPAPPACPATQALDSVVQLVTATVRLLEERGGDLALLLVGDLNSALAGVERVGVDIVRLRFLPGTWIFDTFVITARPHVLALQASRCELGGGGANLRCHRK